MVFKNIQGILIPEFTIITRFLDKPINLSNEEVSMLWNEILIVCSGDENEELCDAKIYARTLCSLYELLLRIKMIRRLYN